MSLALSMPEISLLFFLGLFIALLAWLFIFRRRGWDAEARMPLEEVPADRDDGNPNDGDQRHA